MTITAQQQAELTEKAYTGQPMNAKEQVVCNKCKEGLVHLRGDAWFDPHLPFEDSPVWSKGSYVHYGCLSDQRKAEIRAEYPLSD